MIGYQVQYNSNPEMTSWLPLMQVEHKIAALVRRRRQAAGLSQAKGVVQPCITRRGHVQG